MAWKKLTMIEIALAKRWQLEEGLSAVKIAERLGTIFNHAMLRDKGQSLQNIDFTLKHHFQRCPDSARTVRALLGWCGGQQFVSKHGKVEDCISMWSSQH